jgi:hypothetical protein
MKLSQQLIESLNKQNNLINNNDNNEASSSSNISNINPIKKFKAEETIYSVSKVLFIRNVYSKTNPNELVSLFYETTNCL